ncbi:MAG: hypothetical protein GY910_11925 [bacterium]|nr:hypothetical protein [Deltaproteobacteria bacterium]MCP4905677.1 hypothetical protein [bacterium]
MNPSHDRFEPLSRREISERTLEVLNRGGWGNPDVLLVEVDGGRAVVKDFAPRKRWVRRFLAPRLIAREEEAYRRLEGVPAIPRLLGRLDGNALMIEYRPGVFLSRSLSSRLPPGFLGELEATIHEMHRRGVVHLDLRHRSNILAGEDGRPIVIDFASALRFDATTAWGRALVVLFGWVDRRAMEKWRVRLG